MLLSGCYLWSNREIRIDSERRLVGGRKEAFTSNGLQIIQLQKTIRYVRWHLALRSREDNKIRTSASAWRAVAGMLSSRMSIVASLVAVLYLCGPSLAITKCFNCRSRGELGDCRDPFYLATNSTIIESKRSGVSTPPCSSGWCRKILEGVDKAHKDAEYGAATQRDCMVRAPSDSQERCAFVKYRHKQVFMCFCKGDLCNHARSSGASVWIIAISAAVLLGMGR